MWVGAEISTWSTVGSDYHDSTYPAASETSFFGDRSCAALAAQAVETTDALGEGDLGGRKGTKTVLPTEADHLLQASLFALLLIFCCAA